MNEQAKENIMGTMPEGKLLFKLAMPMSILFMKQIYRDFLSEPAEQNTEIVLQHTAA